MVQRNPLAPIQEAIHRAAQKHPEHAGLLSELNSRFVAADTDSRKHIAPLHQPNYSGIGPDGQQLNHAVRAIRDPYQKGIAEDFIAAHGEAGQKAWDAVGEESRSKSIFEPVVKQVYNSEKGGLQTAGLMGLIAGIAATLYMGKAAGTGMGWPTLIGLATVAPAFAWGANKLSDWISGMREPSPGASPALVQSQGQAQNATVAMGQARTVSQPGATDIGYEASGTLPSPLTTAMATPKTPPARA